MSNDSPAEPCYRATGRFMLRAPVLPADTFPNLAGMAPPDTGPAAAREVRRTMLALTESSRVRQALHAASPGLAAGINTLTETATGKDAEKAFSALLRYLTRMSTRPTPHGLFAGVAAGEFTTRTEIGLAADPVRLTRTRSDGAWLEALIHTVEQDPALRDLLPVRVNSLLSRVGTRVVLERGDRSGNGDEHVDIAFTRPVEAAFHLASRAPSFGDLVAALVERFPEADAARVRSLLSTLWDAELLISDLRPPLTEPYPESHVADVLRGRSPELDAIGEGLRLFRRQADDIDGRRGEADLVDLEEMVAQQRRLTPGFAGTTYQSDTAVAVTGAELSREVADAAARAADLLMRLGSVRPRRSHIANYHREFLERYGVDSEIPLLDVLSAETGLGPPNLYLYPPRARPLPTYAEAHRSRRDGALIRAIAGALRDGRREVEIDDELLDDLTAWRPGEQGVRPRTSLDLYFQVAARSADDLREGRWRLVLGPMGCHGGLQTIGRFFDLLDRATLDDLHDHLRAEEAVHPGTIFAELSYYAPEHARKSNLTIRLPDSRDYEICVNVPPRLPPEQQIPLTDVLLGADGERFYLRSARLGRRLHVAQTHALNAMSAPNVCRALVEFSTDGYTPPTAFDLGGAADAPFVPRLVRDRVVLHPAQWTLTADTFTDALDDRDAFARACAEWRTAWNVPRYVYLSEYDQRLLLDLEHPSWVEQLRKELRRRPRTAHAADEKVCLQEMLPGPQELWLRDAAGRPYHSEFIAPMLLRTEAEGKEAPRAVEHVTRTETASVPRRCLPGDAWTFVKLYSAPNRHDAVIAGPLRTLVDGLRVDGLIDDWFYLRYSDPLPHLRLRFRVRDSAQADALMARCARWGRDLVAAGQANDLVLAGYDREVERYGGQDCIELLERAFSANSDVCAELVALLRGRSADLDPDVAGVAALQALFDAWGGPPSLISRGRAEAEVPDAVRQRFRHLRPVLCEVLAPGELRPSAEAARHRESLAPVLERQRRTLSATGGHVRRIAAQGRLTGSEENILQSLAHIQSNRLFGIDLGKEMRCRNLWALTLRAIDARRNARRSVAS